MGIGAWVEERKRKSLNKKKLKTFYLYWHSGAYEKAIDISNHIEIDSDIIDSLKKSQALASSLNGGAIKYDLSILATLTKNEATQTNIPPLTQSWVLLQIVRKELKNNNIELAENQAELISDIEVKNSAYQSILKQVIHQGGLAKEYSRILPKISKKTIRSDEVEYCAYSMLFEGNYERASRIASLDETMDSALRPLINFAKKNQTLESTNAALEDSWTFALSAAVPRLMPAIRLRNWSDITEHIKDISGYQDPNPIRTQDSNRLSYALALAYSGNYYDASRMLKGFINDEYLYLGFLHIVAHHQAPEKIVNDILAEINTESNNQAQAPMIWEAVISRKLFEGEVNEAEELVNSIKSDEVKTQTIRTLVNYLIDLPQPKKEKVDSAG